MQAIRRQHAAGAASRTPVSGDVRPLGAHCCPAWLLLQIFKEAQDLLPGGVNSPVRAFKSVGGQPIVFDHVKVPLLCLPPLGLPSSVPRSPARKCLWLHLMIQLMLSAASVPCRARTALTPTTTSTSTMVSKGRALNSGTKHSQPQMELEA